MHHQHDNNEAIVLQIALFGEDTFRSAKTAKPGSKPDFCCTFKETAPVGSVGRRANHTQVVRSPHEITKKHHSECHCASKCPRGAHKTFISELEMSHKRVCMSLRLRDAANGFASMRRRRHSRVSRAKAERRMRRRRESAARKNPQDTDFLCCVHQRHGDVDLLTASFFRFLFVCFSVTHAVAMKIACRSFSSSAEPLE